MSRIFISHTPEDDEVATRIYDCLVEASIEAWIDHKHIQTEEDKSGQLEKALDSASAIVLVLSPAALNSPTVAREYQKFLRQNKRVYIVMVKAVRPDDLPRALKRSKQFNLTKNFEEGIQKLIQTLQNPTASKRDKQRLSVLLEIDADQLAPLVEKLNEAGIKTYEVETLGERD